MRIQRSNTLQQRQTGVGMIEVLVTLFILSVGLLGVASLQFISSLSNSDALSRSQSVMVAQQLSERLRASAVMSQVGDGMVVDNAYFNADIYNFNGLSCSGGGLPFACFCLQIPAGVPDCRGNSCSAAELAAFDAYEASCAAVAVNPGIEVVLTCDDNDGGDTDLCSAGSRHRVMLAWPVESWQDNERVLNAECNEGRSTPHDCVVVEITL
ncbi:prepilin-type N-terminal cleavage/methylation domain-containing protein [Aestuariibacter halophilus]|uniref:Prepilin-type N-terminal cleavage/methylation domain-containing protein n=1 Tax=Fluctibacter halophilus TaxID=226011 RepID=A0ABS8G249_9ALTE|nr:prepilin-type N-terminal cleavage/methylation domain-containing protein [Aestuariibacter halophilus]MCC2614654.1 prepilin-type N-terminal cleavage/methylation domain-containing protein [Aestuariibacter halophilus]